MRSLLIVVVSFLALGCGGFDPVGTYEGTLTRNGETSTLNTDVAADGSANATTSSFTSSQTGVVATVTRVDDNHIDIVIGDTCRVRVEQSPEPNEHDGQVVLEPEQRCHLEVEGFSGDVRVSGMAQFGRDDPKTLRVTLTGANQAGDPNRAGFRSITFAYTFDGQQPHS